MLHGSLDVYMQHGNLGEHLSAECTLSNPIICQHNASYKGKLEFVQMNKKYNTMFCKNTKNNSREHCKDSLGISLYYLVLPLHS